MRTLSIRILKGPNNWSITHQKLVQIKLDLKEYRDVTTELIPNFNKNLKLLLPSLYEHHCSVGKPGGFFERLEEGTLVGHVIEHIALELQWLAGMKCGYGRTRYSKKSGIYNVVFCYEYERAGIYAAKAAIQITETLLNHRNYLYINEDITALKEIYYRDKFGPSTEAIVNEAIKRNIPFTRMDDLSLIMFGQGCYQRMIRATVTSNTSIIGSDFAMDKELTKRMLYSEFIPVPQGELVFSQIELDEAIENLGFPLVIKPKDGNHGRGVTTNIKTREGAAYAFELAKDISDEIIVERYINGTDYRVLLINYQLTAVAKRTPPMIIGDDQKTIYELIEELNSDPRRGEGHDNFLTKVEIDKTTWGILEDKGLSEDSVLKKNQKLYLKHAANLSSGGTAEDVTDLFHPQNTRMMERVARLLRLDICGIDLIAEDISIPINDKNGAIIEVNAGPGLRMHLEPNKGKRRNIGKKIIDMLYPSGMPSRIPIVAVTGTNGKTTVVRIISHLACGHGYSVGYTTTEGININNYEIYRGDCSGPKSASVVLRDPIVDYAVLECARGGILRSGLGFDQCDIGIVTNVAEDHLGINGINTLEEMADLKSVVPRSVKKDGYAILNADDDLVYAMKENLDCKVALFSMSGKNERIINHIRNRNIAAYIENDYLVFSKDGLTTELINIKHIPICFKGSATAMIKNVLPAVLAGIISGFAPERIMYSLKTFYPDPESLPGRMNLFKFDGFTVMVDYAHNADAFISLKDYLKSLSSPHKIGIIAATGDRRENDIINIGRISAEIFDEIIIRHDKDSRGSSYEKLTALLMNGIRKVDDQMIVSVIPNEFEAIRYAMDNAPKDAFIFYFPDDVMASIDHMKKESFNYINTSDYFKPSKKKKMT